MQVVISNESFEKIAARMKRRRDAENVVRNKKSRGYVQHHLSADAPRAIDVIAHASERIQALLALEESLGEANKLITLPHHLRRRATSYNRRGRRRGPGASCREQSATSAQLVANTSHRPRIHRRQPYLLQAQWSMSNSTTVQSVCAGNTAAPSSPLPPLHLPNHLWHAKRCAMKEYGQEEGWELPVLLPCTRADAGLGAILRWSRDWGLSVPCARVGQGQGEGEGQGEEACVAHDSTALHLPLLVRGTAEDVLACLERVLQPTAVEALRECRPQGERKEGEGGEDSREGGVEQELSKAQRARHRRSVARSKWRQAHGHSSPVPSSSPDPPLGVPLPVQALLYQKDTYPQGPVAPVQVQWLGEQGCLLYCPAAALHSCLAVLRATCADTPCTLTCDPLLCMVRYSLRGHPQAVWQALAAVLGTESAQQAMGTMARGRGVYSAECEVVVSRAEVEKCRAEGAVLLQQQQGGMHALCRGQVWDLGAVHPSQNSSAAEEDASGPFPSYISLSSPGPLRPAATTAAGAGIDTSAAQGPGGQARVGYPLVLMPVYPIPEGEHARITLPFCPRAHLPAASGVDLLLPTAVARAVWGRLVREGQGRAIGLEGWRAIHTARGLPCFPWGHIDTAVGASAGGDKERQVPWRSLLPTAASSATDTLPTVVHGLDHALDMLYDVDGEGEGEGEAAVLLRVHVRCVGAGHAPRPGQALYVPGQAAGSSQQQSTGALLGYMCHGVVADGAGHRSSRVATSEGGGEGEGVEFAVAGQGSGRCPPRGVGLAFISLQQARACVRLSPSLPHGTFRAALGTPTLSLPVLLTLT